MSRVQSPSPTPLILPAVPLITEQIRNFDEELPASETGGAIVGGDQKSRKINSRGNFTRNTAILFPMTKVTCRGVLFDLDGVLVDSTPAVARVWAAWAKTQYLDPETIVKMAHGRPSIATIKELLPDADHAAEDREVERLEIADIHDVVALPGATHLLSTLPAARIAIVTSATRPLAEVRLRAAGFSVPAQMITANDISRGKPDPEPYVKGAQRLKLSPADCVVIEDAPAGIRAGKAAGARVIALRTTASDAELCDAGADWIVDSCAAITIAPESTETQIVLTLGEAPAASNA
jgi:sugar-phosphatase